jgi:hypothetical protein
LTSTETLCICLIHTIYEVQRNHSHESPKPLLTGKDIQDLTLNFDKINESILRWFDNNRLIINKNKSLVSGFHHKLDKHIVFPDTVLKDTQITYVSETKCLEVWLNHNLTWDFHARKLII